MAATSMSEAQKFIYISRYARWLESEQRRESNWSETASRYFSFMWKQPFGEKVPKSVRKLCEEKVKALDVMPSMRAAWSAGEALELNHILAYNCCYVPFVDLLAPVEMFFILMCGTGVGFSTEREYVSQMPVVQKWNGDGVGVHVVGDSREGWSDSLKAGFEAWFAGKDIEFDYSKVRPRGARLKRMGGRASGPAPLKKLHEFCRKIIAGAAGRQLSSVEWLDIGNMIGEVVVVGGVRRASEINFSDLNDQGIATAKVGNFYSEFPHRAMSNNSAVYFRKPDAVTFMREWTTLAASGSGERGIYNVGAIEKQCNREWSRRRFTPQFRSNPCGEIILRPFQFCNLTEVVVRANDEFDDLVQKTKAAVWLGAMQSSLTKFPYIRDEFRQNCEEERLLGVSLTGQMDNPALLTAERLHDLKAFAVKVAKRAAEVLGINFSVAITTGKPSGTVSQLVDAASGMHARHSRFYLRRYRIAAVDPLFRLMTDQGVEFTPENGQGPGVVETKRAKLRVGGLMSEKTIATLVPDWTEDSVQTWVCAFPVKAPEGCVTRNDLTAIQQLEWYLKLQKNWCEHNQSATVYVRDEEWPEVGAWVYKHFDEIVGISFLPHDGGSYEQAPYEEITEAEYEKVLAAFPKLTYSALGRYEVEDNTTGAQNLACTAGVCEII